MLYRVKQVLWAWTARPLSDDDLALLGSILSRAERELFQTYTLNDQNHGIRVVKLIDKTNEANMSLQKAALLHDVGKTKVGRLSVIDRSIAVAVKKLFPAVSRGWGDGELALAKRYQIPSIVRAQHAAWGAEMVQAAGGDPLTVALIRRHQDKLGAIDSEEDRLLQILQTADDLS